MKNTKKFLMVLLALLISMAIITPKLSIADFGDFESYDSGWDSDWDSDWGSSSSSSWDSDWHSSNSYGGGYYSRSSGSLGEGGWVFIVIIIIIMVIFSSKGKANRMNTSAQSTAMQNQNRRSSYVRDTARSAQVATNVMAVDKFFQAETFLGNAKNLFVKLQNAWADRNLETLRPLVSAELFDQYSKNVQNYIDNHRVNKLERISTNFAELVSFSQDNEKDTLVVAVNASMVDYIVDENSGMILKGDNSTKLTNTYRMTFTRKKGILTQEGTSKLKTTNCPNCGAPTTITSSGRCEYCNSVITTGSHDWVLSGIERY